MYEGLPTTYYLSTAYVRTTTLHKTLRYLVKVYQVVALPGTGYQVLLHQKMAIPVGYYIIPTIIQTTNTFLSHNILFSLFSQQISHTLPTHSIYTLK